MKYFDSQEYYQFVADEVSDYASQNQFYNTLLEELQEAKYYYRFSKVIVNPILAGDKPHTITLFLDDEEVAVINVARNFHVDSMQIQKCNLETFDENTFIFKAIDRKFFLNLPIKDVIIYNTDGTALKWSNAEQKFWEDFAYEIDTSSYGTFAYYYEIKGFNIEKIVVQFYNWSDIFE